MKIISARISGIPTSFADFSTPTVHATTEDGVEHELFTFYHDEISFQPGEFIGLTLEQGKNLKFKKDCDYLRS